ncbi:hypothetical protein BD413DRAFT_615009 [Trametes elegans]|nr:hypothetical protein BD413DRAFT_615009 [Trametes elegans]
MHRWYENAYLADVSPDEDPWRKDSGFRPSVWFTRGWTLQELVAPRVVVLLSNAWTPIGAAVCVAERMSWAACRETTRLEDEVHSLMGSSWSFMPTIYGEGRNALCRLQERILTLIPD